mmetsp:Transcript_31858/g.43702  ORF Transcript_31858/g.43702 Transcript_31858/m.43702 type:complete len:238 (+) Transcript_31858:228-941(+)
MGACGWIGHGRDGLRQQEDQGALPGGEGALAVERRVTVHGIARMPVRATSASTVAGLDISPGSVQRRRCPRGRVLCVRRVGTVRRSVRTEEGEMIDEGGVPEDDAVVAGRTLVDARFHALLLDGDTGSAGETTIASVVVAAGVMVAGTTADARTIVRTLATVAGAEDDGRNEAGTKVEAEVGATDGAATSAVKAPVGDEEEVASSAVPHDDAIVTKVKAHVDDRWVNYRKRSKLYKV